MPWKNQEPTSICEGGSTSKRAKASSPRNSDREDSPPRRDGFTRMMRRRMRPRGYPMPDGVYGGMRLVNTFELCFKELDGYNEDHTKIKLLALSVSQSIVSLASFKGKTRQFTCTGTIVGRTPSSMSILTSASLVRCTNDETEIDDKLKIKVRLPNGKIVPGKLWKYDLYYNIAVVNMKAFPEFRAADIHNQVEANAKLPQSKLVAIGRAFESGELMATAGTLLYKTTKLDCQELMTSSCYITKAGIGGPLIGYGGNFFGMNFCSDDGTPFLPASLLSKCLKHFDTFGRVVQPWLGLRIGSLQAQKLGTRVELHDSFPDAHGIYVERVFDGSPAANSGMKVGDVITKLDEVPLFSAQEFHKLVLDKTESTTQHGDVMPFEVSVLRPGNSFDFCATINAEVIDMSKQNRWPVPKTKWIYPDNEYDDEGPLVRKCSRPDYRYPSPDEDESTQDCDEE
ncbi:hypothetical protein CFC21_071672 [Triticum aestivum]|uniref:PDZ domain-containing protein n=2 Tax=Triticum aestivum TaxID=4565 RepID=A0A9R1HIR8_WHEAT|nr:putative protease Do-like 14 isoform X1 [Triticum aestivum]KAF7065582.1 hypothetical protein CFC21_071672 [Triticum aestivum]